MARDTRLLSRGSVAALACKYLGNIFCCLDFNFEAHLRVSFVPHGWYHLRTGSRASAATSPR